MQTIQDFLLFYRRQRSWTRSLIAAVPEEHFGWRPSISSGQLESVQVDHPCPPSVFPSGRRS